MKNNHAFPYNHLKILGFDKMEPYIVPFKNIKFLDYMPNSYEYLDPTTLDISAAGWVINYISSTFLNGWINYVNPISAFVVHRYHELEKSIDDWHNNYSCHTDLGQFGDDVILLCKSDNKNDFWYFWFDNDVSDCSIGRFTNDNENEVKEKFEEFVKERAEDLKSYHGGEANYFELDVRKINRCIKF